MKKFLKTLALSVLCLAVMSVAAFAAENITANEDGTFPASYESGTEGQYYALVVVKGTYTESDTPTISEDTVLHIDQVTAGASGALFEDFTPKTNDAATVYLGGSDMDEPVILGYINAEPVVTEYKVSVAVTANSSAAASVVLTAGEASYAAAYDEAANAYVATVPAGTYKAVVTVAGHLSYTKNTLEVAADVSMEVELKGGDVDASGVVDFTDLSTVLNNYKTTEASADIDGNGEVNFTDLSIVLNNYKAEATVE